MSSIIFATGGTTKKSRIVAHSWDQYDYVINNSKDKLYNLFCYYNVVKIANCLSAGNLWGGFLFIHDLCKNTNITEFPFSSNVDIDILLNNIKEFQIDTIVCLPSFAIKLFTKENSDMLKSINNIYYLGEFFSIEYKNMVHDYYPAINIVSLVYTTQETGVIGYFCNHLQEGEYHIFPHVSIEIHNKLSEIIVSICDSKNNTILKNHNTNDIGTLTEISRCICGYVGHNIILKSRSNSYANIFGNSVSINEFINFFRKDNKNIKNEDFQICVAQNSHSSHICVIINDKKIRSINIFGNYNSNIMQEIIDESSSFAVYFVSKIDFLKLKNTGKTPLFFHSSQIPEIKYKEKYYIKINED